MTKQLFLKAYPYLYGMVLGMAGAVSFAVMVLFLCRMDTFRYWLGYFILNLYDI